MKFTIFNSLDNGKHSLSPYDNGTFDFKNIEINISEVHKLFEKYYVLSRSLIKDINTTRDTQGLIDYYDNDDYIVIDIDDVNSKKNEKLIIDYFINNKYNINIFKSSSYNIKHNMKCVLSIDFASTRTNLEASINKISEDLKDLCKVDISSTRFASYQAPTKLGDSCLLYQYGRPLSFSEISEYTSQYLISEHIDFEKEASKWMFDYFVSNYSMEYKNRKNANNTIQCSLPSETKSKFGYYWDEKFPYLLQHPQRVKTINIYHDFIKSDFGKKYIKNKSIESFKENFILNPKLTIDNRFIEINKNILDIVNSDYRVLAIKSAMGTGKSNIIQEILKKDKSRILFISMRRSLSYDIKEKYSEYNVKHYIDNLGDNCIDKYRIGDNLVVQIDSLYKVNINNFDTIIIDEFESMCLYTQQNMINSSYYVSNMRNLKNIFKDKKLIILDAFINKLSLSLYFDIREVNIIENTYKDDIKTFIYEDKNTFLSMIENIVRSKNTGEVVTCSFSTLSELFGIKERLEKHSIKCVAITSETPSEAKKIIQELIKDKTQDKYDVLLFSPSITVGISILNNVIHHFHYDTGKTIDAISSVQMVKRSRTATNIHCFISGRNNINKSYDVNILNEITRKNINTYLNDSKNTLFYNIDTGDISELGKFVNSFIAHKNFYTNNHKESFIFLLGIQFKNISVIKHKSNKVILKKKKESKIINFNNLDLSDLSELRSKQDKSKEENIYLELLEIKKDFILLSDEDVNIIYNKKLYLKLKNINIFKNTSIDEKNKILTNYVINNIKDVLLDSKENIVILQKMIEYKDMELLEFYKEDEVQDKEFLKAIGYKYRNKIYKLDSNIKRLLSKL